VGVNGFVDQSEDIRIPILRDGSAGVRAASGRIQRVKAERDSEKVGAALQALREAAQGTANTMPFIIDAVREYATLGEITDVFREVFGKYEEPTWI
jgi:methylmalonyl-CoA mutase N-terminal domain/subunit